MTPFLALVLAGFGLFIVALGSVSIQDQLSRARATRETGTPPVAER